MLIPSENEISRTVDFFDPSIPHTTANFDHESAASIRLAQHRNTGSPLARVCVIMELA
jgi:hypothetical protein